MNDQSPSPAKPDLQAIARHLELVFGYLEGLVPIRLFAEAGTAPKTPKTPFAPAGSLLSREIQRLATWAPDLGYGVYVVPGVVAKEGSAGADDVVASGVLLIDLDHGDIVAKRAHLEQHLGAASLVVASGGRTAEGQAKLHCYWRLTEGAAGADLKTLTRLRAIIAERVGGDRSFRSIHQPIRVAGTVHGKHGVQRLVRIVEDRPLEYDLSDLVERVEDLPPGPGGTEARSDNGRSKRDRPPIDDLMTSRIHAGATDDETRYSALTRIIGHWIRQVRSRRMTLDGAWDAVLDHNVSQIVPPWPETQLRREFVAVLRLDISRNGPMPAEEGGQKQLAAPELSEDALAAAFIAQHAGEWRHVAAWGAWMRWTGTRWLRDDTLAVREAIRQTCRAAIGSETKAAEAKRVASDRTIRAVERIAAADPAVAARSGDWDGKALLLNTPGGIIDLETGEVLEHDPACMLTQMTTASVGSSCPQWCAFLTEVAGGDGELVAYLQRLSGYCLSGSTEEQVFAFLYGSGANGKSVFLQAISHVLGSYAATAPLGTFMASRNDAHPTDLAGLVGKRLVTVTETEAGRAWAESRIKTITGGDPIRARFMHRDFFEFTPTFKLAVAGNHRPRLSGVGEAMRRRMHLVPFTVTIPSERRDRRLLERLMDERDGIIGWMIEGFAQWRRTGLSPPASVLQSAEDYFDDEDLVGQWIEERCVLGPAHRASARELFQSWCAWATDAGAEGGSQKTLGDALRERGFTSKKVAGQRGWLGIAARRGAYAQGGEE